MTTEELNAELKKYHERCSRREEMSNMVERNVKLDEINKKTASGITYTLNNLYNEMINSDEDLLRCLAVKISAEIFEIVGERMPEGVNIIDYISRNEKGDNNNE